MTPKPIDRVVQEMRRQDPKATDGLSDGKLRKQAKLAMKRAHRKPWRRAR